MGIKIAPQIKDHLLLKGVIEENAQRIENLLQKEGESGQAGPIHQVFGMVLQHHLVDHLFRHVRRHQLRWLCQQSRTSSSPWPATDNILR